jgi:hypothetical protein
LRACINPPLGTFSCSPKCLGGSRLFWQLAVVFEELALRRLRACINPPLGTFSGSPKCWQSPVLATRCCCCYFVVEEYLVSPLGRAMRPPGDLPIIKLASALQLYGNCCFNYFVDVAVLQRSCRVAVAEIVAV